MENLKSSIQEGIMAIESNTVLFYQQKPQEGFRQLDTTLSILMDTVNKILKYQSGKEEKIFEDQIFNAVLAEAMKAIEKKDIVLLADILIFEVSELLQESMDRI